uniref:Ig-like domain-containing protein n=1 Tax=Naja naja TaxID=35670 RepID=A0A8C6VEZ5_NAJNA
FKVLDSSQGLPQFLSVIHLDDHPIARYDILNRRTVPLVPWMEAEEVKMPERMFRADLEGTLDNSTPSLCISGLHTWQVFLGCELREDGSKGGFLHYGYDGMDFISFENETLRWVATQPQAEKVKEKKRTGSLPKRSGDIYPNTPPVGKVSHKEVNDSLEVLICQAFGFYPKEIQATWRRDGEVWKDKTLHRNMAPNSDRTYYVWLSIEIDPKERDRFRCHLEHEGLQEPLDLAFLLVTGKSHLQYVTSCVEIDCSPLLDGSMPFSTGDAGLLSAQQGRPE